MSETRSRGQSFEEIEIEDKNEGIAMKSEDVKGETIRIILAVLFYFVVSLTLVFLNKSLMNEDFGFPIFVTWCQFVVTIIFVAILGELGKSYSFLSMIQPFEFHIEVAHQIFPLSLIFVAMMAFNNLCLYYVEVSFYQVARSLTLCFTSFFTYYLLGMPVSKEILQACLIIVAGFAIGSIGEYHFSWQGLFYGVTSSVFVSLYGIYIKKCLAVVNGDHWKLLSYNIMLSIPLLFPALWLFGEVEGLRKNEFLFAGQTWINIIMSGIFGLLINIAVFIQIKFTSPLTNNIAGTMKSCMQTLFAMLIYKNPISFVNAVGIILVIVGSFLYSNVRYQEMREEKRPNPVLLNVAVQDTPKAN